MPDTTSWGRYRISPARGSHRHRVLTKYAPPKRDHVGFRPLITSRLRLCAGVLFFTISCRSLIIIKHPHMSKMNGITSVRVHQRQLSPLQNAVSLRTNPEQSTSCTADSPEHPQSTHCLREEQRELTTDLHPELPRTSVCNPTPVIACKEGGHEETH